MRKKIIISNWINIFVFGLYIALFTSIDAIINDINTTNIFVNIIGNLCMGVLYGIFYPIGWALPITAILLTSLITTDLILLNLSVPKWTSFFIQCLVLLVLYSLLMFLLSVDKIHFLFFPFFLVGQYIKFKKNKTLTVNKSKTITV